MDLAELKFVVDTKQLEEAAKQIEALGTFVSKLNKPMQEFTRESAKTSKELSKAEEAAAKAALAQEKLEQAQSKSVQATSKSVSVLERQNLILEYMAQGNSKGQASILATAKAAGALDDEMLELNKTLVTQRTLIGGDPFDKSIGLMQKLQNEYKTTTEVTNLFNKNLGLTEKQMVDLAREKQRLIALYGIEGKSLSGLSAEYDQLIQKSVMINRANSDRTNSMKAQVKAQDDALKASAYLAKEMERVNRLNESGSDITSATNNRLIKFEQALKASGATAEQQVIKLEKYKTALLDTQKAAGNRQVDYLSRALGPQITDIFVGLATGQSPMMVLLQQGGQLRDQFALAGVAGKDMGEMLTKATIGMVGSVKDVAVAVGGALGGAFLASGKAVNKFIGDITGLNSALEYMRYQIALADGSSGLLMKTFKAAGATIQILTGVIVGGAVAALVAYGVAIKQVISEESALSKSLALTGASLGITRDSALALSQELAGSKGNIGSYVTTLTAIAKAGGVTSENLKLVASTIANTSKILGVSADDLAKNFSKISDKPTESLITFAKELGTINVSVLKHVQQLEKSGKYTEAATIATEAYAKALRDAANVVEKDAGYIESFFKGIADAATDVWHSILNWGRAIPLVTKLADAQKELADLESGKGFMTDQYRKNSIEVAKATVEGIQKQIDAEKQLGEIKAKNSADAKTFERSLKKQEAISVAPSKDLSIIQKDYAEQLKLAEGFAKDQRSVLKARYDAGLIDRAEFITQDTALLQRSEQKQLDVINKFSRDYADAYAAQAQKLTDALGKTKDADNRKKLIEDITNLGKEAKEFFATIEDKKSAIGSAFSAREQVAILEFEKAVKSSTEAYKQYSKTQDDVEANRKIDIELQDRLTNAYGAEAVRIKAVAEETKRQTAAISQFVLAQEEAYRSYLRVLNDPNSSWAAIEAAGGAYTTAMINANKAIARSRISIENAGTDAVVAYYKQEYERISSGITDSIVTALFEGGKAGSKKLRDLIIAELKKPITIVVKAVVDATLGSMIQSFVGNAAASSAGASFAGSAAGAGGASGLAGITVGGASIASQASAFGAGVANGFGPLAGMQSGGLATSSAYNMGATYGAPVAGVLAGVYGGRAVSGGYSAMGGQSGNSAVNIGTAIGMAIAGPLGAALGGLAGGAFNRTFGRKLTDVGISGTVGGATGFEGQNYTFEKGGFLRSDKTTLSALDEATRSGIASAFRVVQSEMLSLTDALGLGSDAIKNFTGSFKVNLKGLSQDDALKAVDTEFARIKEEMAKAALGTKEYSRQGETSLQTLTRLSTFMKGINTVFKNLGFQTYKLELASLDAAQAFVDLFGGMESFNKTFDFFYQNFFSQTERMANLSSDLAEQFAKLNLSLPGTREEFKQMVITAQKAGDNQLVRNLLSLQYSFAELVPLTEQLTTNSNKYARSLIEAQRMSVGAGVYTDLDFLTRYTIPNYTNADMSTIPVELPALNTTSINTVMDNSVLIEAVNSVKDEIAELRYEVQADVIHNAKTATILTRVVPDGQSINVTAAIDGGVV